MFNRGLSSSGGWTNRLEGTHAMASLGAQMVKNPPVMRKTWVQFLDSEDPLEKRMATHSSILAWRISMDRGTWWATTHGVAESDATEQLSTTQHAMDSCVCE